MPPIIDTEKCTGCGSCFDACAEDVFFGSEKKDVPDVTYPDACCHCNACLEVCPVEGAISLRIPLPLMMLYREG